MMKRAIEEAKKSGNDIPVGAIIVKNGEIIAAAHNEKEERSEITAHAEILAIKKAEEHLNNWRLDGCDMYVTLEPCPMCGWAILQARIEKIYFGSYNAKYGAFGSKIDLRDISDFKPAVYGGMFEAECDEILNIYFKNIR